MAVTKIKPIRGTVNKAIDYILNPAKTDDCLLVSSYACSANSFAAQEFEWTREAAKQHGMPDVKVLARHLIQSFEEGEVTPKQAHKIGQQFADELLKGNYEYVLATHIDKGHIHNHIIFNAVSFTNHHAYRSNKKSYHELMSISDRICEENGLFVVPPSLNKGKDYKEYTESVRGTSWKQKLRQTIDKCIVTAKDFDDFMRLMQDNGYEIKTGKYISFRAAGQERFTRAKTIGDNYTKERIKERIKGHARRRISLQPERRGVSLVIDIQNSINARQSKGYEQWAKVFNLQQAAKTLNFLAENGLVTYSDLQSKHAEVLNEFSRVGDKLKDVEARIRSNGLVVKNMRNYYKLRPMHTAYLKSRNKAEYSEKHVAELMIFDAAKRALKEIYGDKKWQSLQALQEERQELLAEQKRLYDERTKLKDKAKEFAVIKENIDTLLCMGDSEKAECDRLHNEIT